MGAPKIRLTLKEVRRQQRRIKERLALEPKPFVTIVQDENTKEVLGVLYDRNRFPKFQEQCAANGVDISHAELIDKDLLV